MATVKKRLFILAVAMVACASIFLLSSVPVHAATTHYQAPLYVHGGGCSPSISPIQACNNFDSSGDLIGGYYRLSWPSNCSYIELDFSVNNVTLETDFYPCSYSGVFNGYGPQGSKEAIQVYASMIFTNGSWITAAAPIQYT